MAQYVNKIKVPDGGMVRHIIGFGQGDPGYDVLETTSQDGEPCISYYYVKSGAKRSVSVIKHLGRYYVESNTYSNPDSFISSEKKGSTLKNVSRDHLMEAVKAYRAYRIVFNEYKSFRDDILDAADSLECVYLGNMARSRERLKDLLERSGFHVESVDFDMIKTKEGICLSFEGLCFHQDEIIP